ncbi:NAD-dependent epimerase/dehydratase family protein [Aestuariispira insulae]|uniref:UDP-glucose 4-epimerase n=1 Tax=Aestuariispira insulae TaxID=1461337 RepID=A0A3D9H4E0_9PROT|nr:NAD-dependent epimerase/dehydratase family protein [Aestuariispira insulae]RED43796.1 UDP-glucose 4-epimerase [Aestuariispira insulae]
MARYLVTGGAGFIGSHLCDALKKRGDQLVVLDDLSSGKRSNLPVDTPIIKGSILEAGMLNKACRKIDGIFHLAAIASVQKCNEDWAATHAVNCFGTVQVFEQAAQLGIPVVYASSAAVYGQSGTLPLSEDAPLNPTSAYGLDKLTNERQAAVAGHVHGLKSFGLRFFNVYGPRQDPHSPYSGVISIFNEKMQRGEPLTLFGDGTQSRDFIYVADIVAMLLCAMRQASVSAPVFNACTGISETLNGLIRIFADLYGRDPEIIHEAARAGDIRRSVGDPGGFSNRANIRALVSLEEGLGRFIEHMTNPSQSLRRAS